MGKDIASLFSLQGKTALIAGASRGIGEEIARVYGLAGARMVLSSRKLENVKEAEDRIKKETGAEILAVASNISSSADREALVKTAMDWAGRIDILVNNAGTNPASGPLADVEESAWDKIFDVNLKGPFILSRLVYQAWMKDHGGVILNTASAGGYSSSPGINAYNITKAALIHLTKCLAAEWGKNGIRVNALAPGVIKTRLSRMLWDNPQAEERFKNSPVGRMGVVEDIGGTALLLVSDASSFITGQTVVLDGGQLVR
jgi:NAD(P)-dependent dehydrogenase (short-subunit alcohol dehydrogenase family)